MSAKVASNGHGKGSCAYVDEGFGVLDGGLLLHLLHERPLCVGTAGHDESRLLVTGDEV